MDHFEAKLQMQRIQMAMRRNILRKTHSEDLYWAQCLKNDQSTLLNQPMSELYNFMDQKLSRTKMRTRSQEQTPERKKLATSSLLSDFDEISADEGEKDTDMPITVKNRHKRYKA